MSLRFGSRHLCWACFLIGLMLLALAATPAHAQDASGPNSVDRTPNVCS